MSIGHLAAAGLEQEPRSPFRLVDPYLDQTVGGDAAVFLAHAVGLVQSSRQPRVVLAQLGQHVLSFDEP